MNQHHRLHWRIFAILGIFLILSYACVFFLPYEHDCIDDGCAICALVDTARYTFAGMLIVFMVRAIPRNTAMAVCFFPKSPFLRDDTPVARKVKLSN